jgi:hypothetical protein
LVDVEFAASAAHPTVPATVRRVFVKGTSNTLARRLAQQPLLETQLAVRAHGVSSDGDAVLPLTVVRDEAGNITYTDGTGAPGIPARWFARKAGEVNGGASAELRGARKLIEDEIMREPIASHLISTDSSDMPPGGKR